MRGQEYTVMNYLVWAAFAAAFLVAVYAAYNAVASRSCDVSYSQIRDLLQSAAKMDTGCVGTKGPIILCDGTTVALDYVKSQTGRDSACICYSTGVDAEDDLVTVRRAMQSTVAVCVEGDSATLCLGRPLCDTLGPGSPNCVCG